MPPRWRAPADKRGSATGYNSRKVQPDHRLDRDLLPAGSVKIL